MVVIITVTRHYIRCHNGIAFWLNFADAGWSIALEASRPSAICRICRESHNGPQMVASILLSYHCVGDAPATNGQVAMHRKNLNQAA